MHYTPSPRKKINFRLDRDRFPYFCFHVSERVLDKKRPTMCKLMNKNTINHEKIGCKGISREKGRIQIQKRKRK